MFIRIHIKMEEIKSLEIGMQELMERLQSACIKAVDETALILWNEVKTRISLTPHGDVAKPHDAPSGHYYVLMSEYDSPFARRDGTIKSHAHAWDWGVHEVTGEMVNEFDLTPEEGSNVIGWVYRSTVGWDSSVDQHIKDVLQGTDLMIERPVLELTIEEIGLAETFKEKLVNYINLPMEII